MQLFLQDPFEEDPVYLDESIFEACQKAQRGGAMFAFASESGAKLLLEDKTFSAFANAGAFDLVVGVDAVTNKDALDVIAKAAASAQSMTASVFLHSRGSTLFHPKFCWFRHHRGGKLIVGSGNLTLGGLRGNWEAFSVTKLDPKQVDEIESRWKAWKTAQHDLLLPTNDARVLSRASKNDGWVDFLGSEKGKQKGKGKKNAKAGLGDYPEHSPVLIAEIPKGGPRWTSAGFDLKNYEGFFGAKVGTQRRIVLQHVNASGSLGELESRPSVAVKSNNYRFELGAASGLPYPKRGVPIAVFAKIAPRTFRYRLLMPGDPHHRQIANAVKKKWTGPSRNKRRVPMTITDLHAIWPDSPLWLVG